LFRIVKLILIRILGVSLMIIGLLVILAASQLAGPEGAILWRYGFNILGWICLGGGLALLSKNTKRISDSSDTESESA
jgi:hypothetical protein